MNSTLHDIAVASVQCLLGQREPMDDLVLCLCDSLNDVDVRAIRARDTFHQLGIGEQETLKLLAFFRSLAKYGYEPDPASLDHLMRLAGTGTDNHVPPPLDRPAVLMKACWVYEHSPYFVFPERTTPDERDAHVLSYLEAYRSNYLERVCSPSTWTPPSRVYRVCKTGFWSHDGMDPAALIREAFEQGFEGVELSTDFHPFNFERLLPEEIPQVKRRQLRELAETIGIRLDLHSPIIGPYVPSPSPAKGSQRFFDPATCLQVQTEAVQLAIDIGAEAIVFHLINAGEIDAYASLVKYAAGTPLRVTIENYCQIGEPQTSEFFVSWLDKFWQALPEDLRRDNFGVTLDVGHLNVEGEDPLTGSARIGKWCAEKGCYLRMHATDNYGPLLFGPPYFSADVHANVSGRGINNGLIIRMLRSMGLAFNVVAEQIRPLSAADLKTVHSAQTDLLAHTFDEWTAEGVARIEAEGIGDSLGERFGRHPAYHFLAGMEGVPALQEYTVLRRIQDNRHLTVDEARRISEDFAKMPADVRGDLTRYLDDLLLPVQLESGAEARSQLDLVCQNVSGARFWISGDDKVDHIFATDRIYAEGDVICEQNETGSEMYYIKNGLVRVSIDGSEVAVLGAGEVFGEISLFYRIPRSATAQACENDTRVGILTRDDLEALFECRRPTVYNVVSRLFRVLPGRLRNMNDKYRAAIRMLQLAAGNSERSLQEMEEAALSIPLPKDVRILHAFSSTDLSRIAGCRRTVPAGETVISLGDEGDGAFFAISGKLVVSSPSSEGEIILGEIGPGEMFGEMALIESKPRSASVRAETDCELAFISRESFEALVSRKSPLAYRLMGLVCSGLFNRILRLDSLYSEIKRRHRALSAQERLPGEPALARDIVQTILEHRLHQSDLDRILKELSTTNREKLIEKIGGLLKRISALVEVSNRMSDTLSLDVLLPRLMDIVTEALSADRSTLFLNDPATDELFSRVIQGDAVGEIRIPNRAGIAGSVFVSGEAIMIPDVYADPRFNPDVDRRTGYRTRNILCTPLKNKGKTIGVAQVLNKRTGAFDDNDLRLLEALTSQAASALENAQLYERVEKARQEEAKLLEVTNAIASELHLDVLLGKVIRATTEILDADRSTLFMYDPRTRELWSRIAEGLSVKEIRFPASAGIAGYCFNSGTAVNIPDAYADPRFNPDVDRKTGYRTQSILCMPVISKDGQRLAVMQVLNKRGGPFGAMDEKRLKSFSAQVAIALENAQLFQEITNERNYNESILRSLSNGVVTLDRDCNIIKINEAAAITLRWDAQNVVGNSLVECLGESENKWLLDSLQKVVGSGEIDITVDAEIRLSGGVVISVNSTVVPLIDAEKGEAIGYMLIIEDITTEKRMKSTMARYMTKEVADRLLEGEDDALGGVSQTITVLFSDIRGFTGIAEELGARRTVSLLNEYFTSMVDVIFEHHGILDKYLADGLMALFGAPFPSDEDADNAVRVANGMLRELERFNEIRRQQGEKELRIGVGLSTGEVVAGNIGSLKRMDYTVIGDPANVASRLESASKYYGVPILISEFTLHSLHQPILHRPLDLIRVVGKREPVEIFEGLDHFTSDTFPNMTETVAAFTAGIECYRQRQWKRALECFQEALHCRPEDSPSRMYVDRCRQYLQTPPDASWNGVWTMASK